MCEPRLPHPRVDVDREEVRTAVADRAREGVLEQLVLGLPADERRLDGRATTATVDSECHPRPDRPLEAAQLDRAELLGLDPAQRQPVGAGAHERLARLRLLLQTGGDVDRLARRERRVAAVGDDLARLDPDAGLQCELVHGLEDQQRGANRPLRVVLVRLRDAERRHDGVAGELLHLAAVDLDAVRDELEEAVDLPPDHLGIGTRHQPGRIDQVHEHDGCQLALHTSSVETLRTARSFRAVRPVRFRHGSVRYSFAAETESAYWPPPIAYSRCPKGTSARL